MDTGASAKLELVDKFRYVDDTKSVDGDADAAVVRIRTGWIKFRQLLTKKNLSLIMRGRFYIRCVLNSMLPYSETWPVRKESAVALQRAEMRMVRWMCGVKLKDRLPSKELRERLGWHSIGIAAKQAALVWSCAAKRWWWLGEEMHGVWSWGSKAKRKTKENLESGCPRGLSSS